MPRFAYVTVDVVGHRVRGIVQAESDSAATAILRSQGAWVVKLRALRRTSEARGSRASALALAQAMASLLRAGVPLARAVPMASGMLPENARGSLSGIEEGVRRGDALHDALRHVAIGFSFTDLAVLRASERAGDLAGGFERVGALIERDLAFRSSVVSACVYPLVLVAVGSAATSLLLVSVLPRFVAMLGSDVGALPWSTRALMSVSEVLRFRWYWLLLPVCTIMALAVHVTRRRAASIRIGAWIMGMPGVGSLGRDAFNARFCRMLSVLLASGTGLMAAFEELIAGSNDAWQRSGLSAVAGGIRRGDTLAAAMRGQPQFSGLTAQFAALGEESADLPACLERVASILERSVEGRLRRGLQLLEPALILILGALIGGVALGLFQAIYAVNGAVA